MYTTFKTLFITFAFFFFCLVVVILFQILVSKKKKKLSLGKRVEERRESYI